MQHLLSLARRHLATALKIVLVLAVWLGISAYQTRQHFLARDGLTVARCRDVRGEGFAHIAVLSARGRQLS